MEKQLLCCVAVCFVALTLYIVTGQWQTDKSDPVMDGVAAPDIMIEEAKLYKEKQIIKVTDDVWVAVGYGLANAIFVEGDKGLMVIDTTEHSTNTILKDFRNITSNTKPITHIVYTHFHADHHRGIPPFIEDPDNPPVIIAHELHEYETHRHDVTVRHIIRYAMYQFGSELNDNAVILGGPGARININMKDVFSPVPPTRLIKGSGEEMVINGHRTEFIHLPGETNDHLCIWMPDKKVLFSGDNIYKSFPNLYTIRGSPPRDVQIWADTLLKIVTYGAEILVPSHSFPIYGKEEIEQKLIKYSNAIQFVHDQTVRYINKAQYNPDEVARKIKLPKSLAEDSHLQETYGTVEFSSKGVYMQYIGWFSGDVVEMHPLLPLEKAERMIKLVGKKQLLRKSEEALLEGDLQWALELATFVFRVDASNEHAKLLRREIFRELAAKETTPNGRHFYLQTALNDDGRSDTRMTDPAKLLMSVPINKMMRAMQTALIAEAVDGVKQNVLMNFTDINEAYYLKLEDSVLRVNLVEERPPNLDLIMTTESTVFKEIVARVRNPLLAYMTGALEIEGGLLAFKTFTSYLESQFDQ